MGSISCPDFATCGYFIPLYIDYRKIIPFDFGINIMAEIYRRQHRPVLPLPFLSSHGVPPATVA